MHVRPGYLKVPELLSTFSVGYPLRTCSLENRANDENSVIYHRLIRLPYFILYLWTVKGIELTSYRVHVEIYPEII